MSSEAYVPIFKNYYVNPLDFKEYFNSLCVDGVIVGRNIFVWNLLGQSNSYRKQIIIGRSVPFPLEGKELPPLSCAMIPELFKAKLIKKFHFYKMFIKLHPLLHLWHTELRQSKKSNFCCVIFDASGVGGLLNRSIIILHWHFFFWLKICIVWNSFVVVVVVVTAASAKSFNGI